jgi:hypothetical protein
MVDVRRYFNEQGQQLPEEDMLASEAITAEGVEEEIGPTAEVPFRYTQQEKNPRAEAVSGLSQRDPRGRSAIGMANATSMDDLQFMQHALGLSDEKIDFSNTRFMGKMSTSSADLRDAFFLGNPMPKAGPDYADARQNPDAYYNPSNTYGPASTVAASGREFRDRFEDQAGNFSAYGRAMGLSDEQKIYRGYSLMKPEERAKLDLNEPEVMMGLMRVGGGIKSEMTPQSLTAREVKNRGNTNSGWGVTAGSVIKSAIGGLATMVNPLFGAAFAAAQSAATNGFDPKAMAMAAAPSLAAGLMPVGGGGIGSGFGRVGTTTMSAVNSANAQLAANYAGQGLAPTVAGMGSQGINQIANMGGAISGLGGLSGNAASIMGGMGSGLAGDAYQYLAPQAAGSTGLIGNTGLISNLANSSKGIFDKGKELYANPLVKQGAGIGRNIVSSARGVDAAQQMADTSTGMGDVRSAQQAAAGAKIKERLQDNPYYNPDLYSDLEAGQVGVV